MLCSVSLVSLLPLIPAHSLFFVAMLLSDSDASLRNSGATRYCCRQPRYCQNCMSLLSQADFQLDMVFFYGFRQSCLTPPSHSFVARVTHQSSDFQPKTCLLFRQSCLTPRSHSFCGHAQCLISGSSASVRGLPQLVGSSDLVQVEVPQLGDFCDGISFTECCMID